MSQSNQKKGAPGMGPRGGMHGAPKPKNALKTLWRLLGTLSGSAPLVIVAVLLGMLSSLSSVAGTWYLKPLINGLISGDGAAHLASSLAVMCGIYAVGIVCTYIGNRVMIGVAQRTTNMIRSRLFNHLQDLPLRYFDSHAHGELMSRFTNDVDSVNMMLEQSLPQMVNSLTVVIGTFAMMLMLSPALTVLVVIMLIIMALAIKTVGGKSAGYFRTQLQTMGQMNGYVEEMIEGQKVVKVFNHEHKAIEGFHEKNELLRSSATDAQTFAGVIMPIMGNLSYIHYALTAMAGAMLSIYRGMDIGTIAAFLQYTRSFSQPIAQMANQANMLLAALAGAERIFDTLDQVPEEDTGETTLVLAKRNRHGKLEAVQGDPFADFSTNYAANAQDNIAGLSGEEHESAPAQVLAWRTVSPRGEVRLTELRGDVRFDHVVFGYLPEVTVLNDISLYAKPGQKIAFVGSTGAGKTTITNLINRFYEIQSGTITYDGIDIRSIKKSDLRRTLGIVLQDVHLFQGTIRDNIRYGKLNATDEEIIRAAKIANAHSFITRLPDGYDTVLSPDGTNLSQGQRQLLSIARAAVADPPVLILDEATSSIDTRTEKLIEQGMNQLMRGRTTFIIAHRLSTVRNANAIMVLEQGEIIERGDHQELLDQRGRYYQLCTGAIEMT